MIKRNIAEKRFWEWTFGYNFKIKFDFLGWNSFVNYFYAEALALNKTYINGWSILREDCNKSYQKLWLRLKQHKRANPVLNGAHHGNFKN